MSKFLDLSEHNTILNYDLIGKADLKGVILKASEGTTFTDSTMEEKYNNLKDKTSLGFYHYLTVTSEPETQAEHFYSLIKDKDFEIIPVVDVEQDQLASKAEEYTSRFMNTFYQLSGTQMIIYSGRCYIEDNFSLIFRSENIFWVADYSANDTPKIENCKVVAWQYTESCHNYNFVDGGVDCSILVDEDSFFLIDKIPYSDTTPVDDYDSILELQRELNIQCFTDDNWDELDEDGVAGEHTLQACPTLSLGAIGNITKWVQKRVGIEADGVFGSDTKEAVIEFQASHCLKGDGIVGKKTWKKLLWMEG